MTVLETREEWACIEHWVQMTNNLSYQRFFIDQSSDYSECQNDWEHCANDGCAMVVGSEVEYQGQCEDLRDGFDYWGICEKM